MSANRLPSPSSAPTPQRERDPRERGFVLVFTALMLVLLVGVAGLAVDLGHWYLNLKRMQNTVDGAALAGAVFMPGDFTSASSSATKLAQGHGYAPGEISVTGGAQANHLRVQLTREVENYFIKVFGIDTTTISRRATAEYHAGLPMGSPASYLGNDPEATDGRTQPSLWMVVASPKASPNFGDRYHAGNCGANATCLGSAPRNPEYSSEGYFYAVKVPGPQPGRDLVFEIFDPAYYETGDFCAQDGVPVWGADPQLAANAASLRAAVASNPAVPAGYYDDAEARYARGVGPWCVGDGPVGSGGGATPQTTTYTVRAPDATPWMDTDNPIIADANCAPRQFRGEALRTTPTRTIWDRLTPNSDPNGDWRVTFPSTAWRQTFANSFRRWVQVCRIPATQVQAGTYLLQVRSNAPDGSPTSSSTSLNTYGQNRFSIRAGFEHPSGAPTDSAVYAQGRLPIFVNASAAKTEFYLARVTPGSTQRMLEVKLWDVSDGGSAGSMRIKPPADATSGGGPMTNFSGCSFHKSSGSWTTDAGTCQISFTSFALNTSMVSISVPIPADYDCQMSDPYGCWVMVETTFAGSVNDTTTWAADMVGNPVHLIE